MLELGKPVNNDIRKAIEESKYGVALLTKNYFKEGKEDSTLYELELFKNKQEKFGDFIFLVFCEHLDHFLNNKKDLVNKEPFHIYWNKGIIKVIEIIVKKVRPELPYSNIELMMIKEPPIPKNQQDAVVLIRMYREEGRNQEASVIALKYLVHHKDANILKLYLNSVEATNNEILIAEAIGKTYEWFKERPDDQSVREKYIKFVQSIGSSEQIAKVIKEAKDWLEEVESTNQNTGNIRIGLLNMVEQKGTPEQVREEINGTVQWLTKNEDNTNVRASLLDLVKARCNDDSLKNSFFENYIDWLNKNKNNEKTIEVRRRFINYISRYGSCDQKKRLKYDTEIWLNAHDKNFEVKKSLNNLESSLYGCYS